MKLFVPNTAVFDSFSFNFSLMLNSTLALNLLQNDVEHICPIVAEFPPLVQLLHDLGFRMLLQI
jgi:hypothetical protein